MRHAENRFEACLRAKDIVAGENGLKVAFEAVDDAADGVNGDARNRRAFGRPRSRDSRVCALRASHAESKQNETPSSTTTRAYLCPRLDLHIPFLPADTNIRA